ncbi:15045_t:CDS:2, partial [Dentiscutata heterogama]
MAAVVALNNTNITATIINAPDGTLLPALLGEATGATVISAHNIKIEKNNMLLGEDIYNQPATKTKPKAPFYQGITTEDVDRIENITKADLQAVAKSLQETMSQATKTLDNSKKSADKRVENTAIIHFLSDLLRKKPYIHPADENNHDPVDDISDSLAGLILNKKTICKILQSELKLIFPSIFLPNANSDSNKANTSKQIPPIQKKIEPQ